MMIKSQFMKKITRRFVHDVLKMPFAIDVHHSLVVRIRHNFINNFWNLESEMHCIGGIVLTGNGIIGFDISGDLYIIYLSIHNVSVHLNQRIDKYRFLKIRVADALQDWSVFAEHVAQHPTEFFCLSHEVTAEYRVV